MEYKINETGNSINTAENKMELSNLSRLSNNELIFVFKRVMSEIGLRDLEAIHEAQEAMKDELLKKETMNKIIVDATKKAAQEQRQREEAEKIEKQIKIWLLKKEHSLKLMEVLDNNKSKLWINVWAGSDKRIYINDGEPFGKKTKEVAVFYATGNNKNAPGTLTTNSSYVSNEQNSALKALLNDIANKWNSTKIDCQEAINFEG